MKVAVVKLTDENRPAMFEVAMSMYLDDECMYCHRNFTREELKEAIWAHPNKYGHIVHKECWDKNELAPPPAEIPPATHE